MQALPPTQQRYTQEMMTLQPPSFAETRVETLNAEFSVSSSLSVICSLPVNAGSAADTAATQARDDDIAAAKLC